MVEGTAPPAATFSSSGQEAREETLCIPKRNYGEMAGTVRVVCRSPRRGFLGLIQPQKYLRNAEKLRWRSRSEDKRNRNWFSSRSVTSTYPLSHGYVTLRSDLRPAQARVHKGMINLAQTARSLFNLYKPLQVDCEAEAR